jgi:excisionase family DNA binding protein
MEKTLFNIDPDKIYMIDEIADILRFSRQTITKEIRSGKLSSVKLGDRTYRVMGSHLLKYLDERFLEAK